MRVQSIISSFVLVIGNMTLHLALAFLSGTVTEPTQDEMDVLQKEAPEGEYECVSAEDLQDALIKAQNLHWFAFGILLYIKLHTPVWSRIIGYFRENKMCCFRSINLRILEEDDIKTLEAYSAQMKQTLKLIEEGKAEVVQVTNEADLLRLDVSQVNDSSIHGSQSIINYRSQPVQIEEEDLNEREEEADPGQVQVNVENVESKMNKPNLA